MAGIAWCPLAWQFVSGAANSIAPSIWEAEALRSQSAKETMAFIWTPGVHLLSTSDILILQAESPSDDPKMEVDIITILPMKPILSAMHNGAVFGRMYH